MIVGLRQPRRVAVFLAIAVAMLALGGSTAQAATKFFDSFFGGTGSGSSATGGLFSTARDIAVNDPDVADDNGVDGWIYVVDQSNNRVQAFDQDRSFQFAIGRDVISPTATTDPDLGDVFEKCTTAADCKGGVAGALGGEFNVAQGIDIDQTTGHIFVSERATSTSGAGAGNRRVQEFTPDGTFVRAFGWDVTASGPGNTSEFETCNAAAGDVCQAATAAGTNPGQFGNSTQAINGLAVAPPGAPNSGEVYVADPGNRRVHRFMVPTNPSAPVVAGSPFGDSGQFDQANWPRDIAADSNGVVYASTQIGTGAATNANGAVRRFDTVAGAFEPPISPDFDDDYFDRGSVTNLEIDQATGHLITARSPGSGGDGPAFEAGVLELDVSDNPEQVDASDIVEIHAQGLGVYSTSSPNAIAAGGGRFFLSTSASSAGTGTGHRVLVLDDTGIDPPPTVELLPPTEVSCATATLRAEVNPNGPTGFATSYRFEVSKDGLSWTAVAANALVGLDGDGDEPVFVDDAASGLEANTLYRVRVVTTRSPAAGTIASAQLIFATTPCPPDVATVAAQHVGDTSAQLIGRVNPNGLATEYWFEWGDDNYGNVAPVPAASAGSGGLAKVVGETLTGLAPGSVYHFRLCAQNALAAAKVCGDDRLFQTRPASAPSREGRAHEMVTSPDKTLRRGGERGLGPLDLHRLQPGTPAPDGNSLLWGLWAGTTDVGADHGFTFASNWEVRERAESVGWLGDAVLKIPPVVPAASANNGIQAVSADLTTSKWNHQTPLFPSTVTERVTQSVHVMDDAGGPRAAGWYPWLEPAWLTTGTINAYLHGNPALIDDEGERLIGWQGGGGGGGGENLRDVVPADGGSAPKLLAPPQAAGQALFLSGPGSDWRPADLINECTGTADGTPTLLPTQVPGPLSGPPGKFTNQFASFTGGSLTLTALASFAAGIQPGHYVTGTGIAPNTRVVSRDSDTQITIDTPTAAGQPAVPLTIEQNPAFHIIGTRPCGEGSPTDVRGAVVGGASESDRLQTTAITAMSNAGDRVFFLSPDPTVAVAGAGQSSCGPGTDAATACPAQLFVRQFNAQDEPTVRWISRAEDALSGAPQLAAAFGNGVAFEGASRDGSVVYFRTNAPLLVDDPNGDDDPLATASSKSWDLYRYELGDPGGDPGAGDPADRLTRVSGGPAADADPNTTCTSPAADCGGAANGGGGVVRFMSDDGERVYFVTAARIPGANNAARPGDATTPTSETDQANTSTRNLYLYDASKTGAAAYRFVARLPFSQTVTDLDSCASSAAAAAGAPRRMTPDDAGLQAGTGKVAANCVHGTTNGDAVVFETTAALTADDTDTAGDVYLYDAARDDLTRVSAPPPGAEPYVCMADLSQAPTARCNGDLGFAPEAGMNLGEAYGLAGFRNMNMAENADGSLKAVYFESRLPLVEGQSGGDAMNVYEWRDGQLAAVSPANSDESAFYTGNSRDGGSVFYWTEQRISAWEIDDADGDVYVARAGGGFPDPPQPPQLCDILAGGCDGTNTPSTNLTPQTKAPGQTNAAPGPRARITIGQIGRRARQAAARNGVIGLRVRASAAGRLRAVARARGRARAGKPRRQVVARDGARVRRAGVVSLRLRLSAAARRELRATGRLRVAVNVRMSGARPRNLTVVLRRPSR